jgi:hypothetical protein
MKIPRSFELYGRTIRVISDELGDDTAGKWHEGRDLIRIDTDQPRDLRVQSFLHEFLHAALEALGREDLSKDEAFVDGLAGLIHQMNKSAK